MSRNLDEIPLDPVDRGSIPINHSLDSAHVSLDSSGLLRVHRKMHGYLFVRNPYEFMITLLSRTCHMFSSHIRITVWCSVSSDNADSSVMPFVQATAQTQ